MPQREESFTHELRHVCMRSTRAFTHVQCSISQVHAQSENHAKTREVWTSCIQVPRARILTIKSHVWFPHEKRRIAAQVTRSIHESPTCTGHRSHPLTHIQVMTSALIAASCRGSWRTCLRNDLLFSRTSWLSCLGRYRWPEQSADSCISIVRRQSASRKCFCQLSSFQYGGGFSPLPPVSLSTT